MCRVDYEPRGKQPLYRVHGSLHRDMQPMCRGQNAHHRHIQPMCRGQNAHHRPNTANVPC
ncbi:hypothetical protein KIN20_007971 [Parelaphostrongylus tenuis]|uniref:Uncharacterized protein n=1 Tax=Parelaphostrongylus tenuis TaxID=148309 RepID=A0AAD5QKD9_PARTN|nr:hypothetical protein KIN20_007971 [Parelaphostrongylus tenuis]